MAFTMALQTERKLIGSAITTALYRRAVSPDTGSEPAEILLVEAAASGRSWISRPGYWKSLFRHQLDLARSEALTGRRELARLHAIESLRTYPFNPQALRLVAALSDDPRVGERWRSAAEWIEDPTGDGCHIDHPLCENGHSVID
jgi:hypothetical protein